MTPEELERMKRAVDDMNKCGIGAFNLNPIQMRIPWRAA